MTQLTTAAAPRRRWVRVVRLSAGVLPKGDLRDRYRLELVAEMWDMDRAAQRRHALSVAGHAWSLRAAATGKQSTIREEVMRRSIRCLLGSHHNVWKSNPDGGRYKQCTRCGRDDYRGGSGPMAL